MHIRYLLGRITAISLIAILAACSSPGTDRATGNTPAAAVPTVGSLPAPIMAAKVDDKLPTYICAADAFASYYTLQVIQQAQLDVKYGFNLGIVPFLLDNDSKYDINEDQRAGALASGQWDCLLTTLDSIALNPQSGQITAVVDESAGADQLWAKPQITTLNDLRGHKIAVTSGSVSEFFTYYVLSVAGVTIDPQTGATIVPSDSITDAVNAFNNGQADAVSGWEPDIADAAKSGGRQLISTDTLRVVIDVIVTSRQAIAAKSNVVQGFHDAWFDALRMASDDFGKFAGHVAAWGHNEWSGVSVANAVEDLKGALASIAQASLDANRIAMRDTSIIQERIDQARRVWAAAGQTPAEASGALIEPKFVLASANKTELRTDKPLPNPSFYMTARPSFEALSPEELDKAQTLAVLPCRTFEFLPGRTDLTDTSQQILKECAIPILRSSPDIYMVVLGSAAWPPGETEQSTRDFAMRRAQSVASFLTEQGINRERLVLQATVPPPERRNLGDDREADRKKDRFVQLTLVLTGR